MAEIRKAKWVSLRVTDSSRPALISRMSHRNPWVSNPSTPGAGGHLLQILRHQNNSEKILGTTFVSKFENLDMWTNS